MLGRSARRGGPRSPSPERRRGRRGQSPPANSFSQLLVETGRSCSEPELPGGDAELERRPEPAAAGPAAPDSGGARPRTRTYSLTRLHYSVYLEPDGQPAAGAAAAAAASATTLPRRRPPITIIGEETRVTDDEPVDDRKQKRKRKPLRKFLSVDNLRKSVRKSKERMQGIDEALRRQARNTLRRMRTERKGFAPEGATPPPPSSPSPPTLAAELEESEAELPAPPPSPPGVTPATKRGSRLEPPTRSDVAFAEDSPTTSDEPRCTPVPPELSIQHELAMAERASGRVDASAAQRLDGQSPPTVAAGPDSGEGGVTSERGRPTAAGAMESAGDQTSTGPAEPANGPTPTAGTPPPLVGAAVMSGSAASEPAPEPTNEEDVQVEKAEKAIEEQERARHRRLTDVGDNEVGNKFEHLYKILIIGELGTGKTSIIKRYVHQFFSAHYRATIGVDFALKVLHWDPNTTVRLQLWDIAGQERFGSMTRVYYKEAVAAFIVFDVTRSVTFDAVMKWKNDLDQKVQLANGDCVPCVLLANKCDLPKEGIVTTPDKLTDWAEQHGFLGWFETSAKENTGIEEASNFLVTKILTNEKSGLMASDEDDLDTLAIGDGQPDSKGCSC